MLPRLAVFSGGFDFAAAEAVAGTPSPRALPRLVDKSLVTFDALEQRYALLEPIRQYARELLDRSGDSADLNRQHFDWFAALCRSISPDLTGRRQQDSLERLHRDEDNLRSAFQWALKARPAAALSLIISVWRFWEVRGAVAECAESIEAALQAAPDAPLHDRTWGLLAAGAMRLWMRDTDRGAEHLMQGVKGAEELADVDLACFADNALGWLAEMRDEIDDGLAHYQRTISRAGLGCDPIRIATAHNNIGALEFRRGDFAAAGDSYRSALAIADEASDVRVGAMIRSNLGELARCRGEMSKARIYLADALQMHQQLGDRSMSAWTLEQISFVCAATGDARGAVLSSMMAELMTDSTTVDHSVKPSTERLDLATLPLDETEMVALRAEARRMPPGDIVRMLRTP